MAADLATPTAGATWARFRADLAGSLGGLPGPGLADRAARRTGPPSGATMADWTVNRPSITRPARGAGGPAATR
jgi:hypothetical protein